MTEDHPLHPKNRAMSFKYAFEGIVTAIKQEPNIQIHCVIAFLIILLGLIFNISKTDWLFVIIFTGLVISVEMTNTAIEAVVDSFTEKEHPTAKLAKDISAGAVLVVSISSAIAGLIIFIPSLSR